MRVAAFQFDVLEDDVAANLALVEQGLRQAAREGCALVCLPEMWPTSFVDVAERAEQLAERTREAFEHVASLSAELELVVAGSGFARSALESGRLTNRLVVHDRGATLLEYDKVHLFSPTAEGESFVAGDEPPPVVEASAGRLSGAICYDLRFPEPFRHAYRRGARLLVCPAQWPTPRATHWRALVVGRAVESQCFVVAANRTGRTLVGRRRLELEFPGNSLIVSPHGEVLAEGAGQDGLVSCEVDLDVARQLRVRVPVEKDERRELYERWSREPR